MPMAFEHYDRFFYMFAAGVGLFLVGVLNVALPGRAWLRAIVTLTVCGAVLAGLGVLTRPELTARAAYVLGGVMLVAALLGSGWMSRKLVELLALLRRPAARWGLVALGGLATVAASAITFQQTDDVLIEQGTADLELMVGKPPSQPSEREQAATDRGTRIVLREAISPREAGELVGPEEKVLRDSRLADQVIRRGRPSDDSNCHGWVFTGGRFHLSPEDVELILKENGYEEVAEPQPGDLVVYRQGGTVAHTAVVRYVAEGQPAMVEGKWGTMGVFLHPADKSTYGTEYTYHRSARQDYNGADRPHLLVGLGGAAGQAGMLPTATE
jgi:hypothetical protein